MLQWMSKKIADWLQVLYEVNRIPETWGSTSVSHETFEQLREQGFFAAGRYLFGRIREVGVLRGHQLSNSSRLSLRSVLSFW
ncbi:hypothetical protein EI42_06339 [Thermosporothrix hazakensis]|jgi:hypothetical protein|uniref:Uncharacterized protein n=1 Tax=Thermosporothrix hazakensis TaxID=644383 RepID=A0A326TZS4_THEHA|nr:hypothetical protein [Thermosporothrix hazakensis]PZW18113.1 hypothetical protein EI42_06339 [Thermosporothrix hazakensis]GCE50616.1 hypothetical protein KTH_54850 [Thermosporothrix hazakensis]